MDAFKILSRPARSSHRKNAPILEPPTVEPHLSAATTTAISASRLKKRKRGLEVQTSELPQELDFFGYGQQHTLLDRERVLPARQQPHSGPSENPEQEDSHATRPSLSSGDCRRILKEHKIKITRLDIAARGPREAGPDRTAERYQDAVINDEANTKRRTQHDAVSMPLRHFAELRTRFRIHPQLAANIDDQGYNIPTEVQLAALPLLMDSSSLLSDLIDEMTDFDSQDYPGADLLTVAPTGSGKTLAFLIPVINSLLVAGRFGVSRPRAVIVSPTKELAIQTVHEADKLSKNTDLRVSLAHRTMSFAGDEDAFGTPQHTSDSESDSDVDGSVPRPFQRTKDTGPPDILVSTPLTLVKALTDPSRSGQSLSHVEYLVLDEADVLLDPLFRKQTLQIWSLCTNTDLRISLWSATMGASVEDIVKSTLKDRSDPPSIHPAQTPVNSIAPLFRLVVGLKDSAIPHISHRLTYCGSERGKLLALRQLLRPTSSTNSANDVEDALKPPFLVFTQTIPRAKALHSELLYDIPVSAGGSSRIAVLHADLPSKARADIMARVRRGEVWMLITTDLLSRGVDFKGVNGVVNYDFPGSSAAYVHRVGRTGRAGREGGVAVTLYDKDDVPYVKNVANVIAAARRAKGEVDTESGAEGSGLEKWLLDSLPKPTKRDRQRLKKRGVESRRPDVPAKGGKGGKTRISTQSGYEKRLQDKRKGAAEANKRRKRKVAEGDPNGREDESDFGGFD